MAKKERETETVTQEQVGDVADVLGADEHMSPESRGVGIEPAKTTAVGQVGGYDAEDLGAGFEDFDQNDMIIPFLAVLQKGSPQVEEENAARIEGAKAGMLMDTVSQELIDGKTGIRFIPVHRDHKYIEWKDRDSGGGLLGVYNPEDTFVTEAKAKSKEFGKIETANGNLSETYTVYGLLVKGEGMDPAQLDYEPKAISFSSTQIKQYKKWMTQAMQCVVRGEDGQRGPLPMFAHVYRLRTQFQENNKGTWYGWSIGFDGKSAVECRLAQDHPLYQAAKNLRDVVKSGKATANREAAVAADASVNDEKF